MGRKRVARVVVREPGTGTRSVPPFAAPESAAWARALLDGGWAAVFLPGEPARLGRLLLWQPAGAADGGGMAPAGVETEAAELVLPHGRSVRRRSVKGYALPVALAVAALSGAQPPHPSAAAWQAAARFALRLLADGRLHPALTPAGYDTWQAGPFTAVQRQTLDALAAAFPPHAHCLPEPGPAPLRITEPAALVRQFCDAVADELVRTPAAPLAMGALPYAWRETRAVPVLHEWAEETAAAFTADVRVSLRVDVPEGRRRRFQAVLQLHTAADPALVVEAARLWSEPAETERLLGPRAETETLLALRRGARAWTPLGRLLKDAAPDQLRLTDDEAFDLLGDATDTLRAAGIAVHWPRELVKALTATAEIGERTAPGSSAGGMLDADALLDFRWQLSLGGEPLTEAEMDALAEARRPLVRLRDQWVVVDPKLVARARRRRMEPLTPMEALGAALTGEVERDGETVPCTAVGALGDLVARIRDPESRTPAPQPTALKATLRDYQQRGLAWLAEMSALGLGGCLADDMGLGKTITLIALHLHRQTDPATAGPTLVVCPASLLGNWQREISQVRPGHARAPLPRRRPPPGGPRRRRVRPGHLRRPCAATAKSSPRTPGRWSSPTRPSTSRTPTPPPPARCAPCPPAPASPSPAPPWRTTSPNCGRSSTGPPPDCSARSPPSAPATPARSRRARTHEAAERLSRLVRPFLLRRKKSDPGIAPELPAKTETDRVVPLTAEQAGLYEAVVRETMAKIAESEGIARRGLVLKLLTALKQICNHPAQYLREHSLRQSTPLHGRSGKLALLDELLDTIPAEGESVLVFTQYKQMASLLEKHLAERGVPTLFLHGGTPVTAREEMVDRFQRGEVPVFLLSLKAAGTGLNLTRAAHVVHYDRWWNPAVEDQATDRAYRIGQDKPVQVHRLLAEGTVEDKVAKLLESKRALADAVVGSGEAALTELSDADLAELVALGRQS